jgi:phosphatidylglycerol lysyltransferase
MTSNPNIFLKKWGDTTVYAESDTDRVLKMLKLYGYQSQSYSILRSDKSYFFSPSGIDGVIAYVVHARVALAAGDPVCAQSDLPAFVAEFKQFCRAHRWRCCFQAITDRCKKDLEQLGFDIIKIGEEPIFELDKLSWAGGKFKDLRNDVNSAK